LSTERFERHIGSKEGIERHIGPTESNERHIHGAQLYLNTQGIWPKQAILPGGGRGLPGKKSKTALLRRAAKRIKKAAVVP
jgi:hypothetical protein